MLLFFCIGVTFLAVCTSLSDKYPKSKFTKWFRRNVIDNEPEDNIFN